MHFLTEEQEMIRRTVRDIAEEKVSVRAAEIDRSDEYPWDLLKLFSNQELMGLGIPQEYGGSGLDLLTCCLVFEELAKVSLTASIMVGSQELGSMPLLLAGNKDQKQKYLPPIAKGQKVCAFGLTEPEAGSDAGSTKTRAIRKGNEYVINGRKCFITNGGIAETYTVFASTDPSQGIRGISAFIVEKGFSGFSIGKKEDKMGIRGSQTAELIFEDCLVPQENLLGQEGDGFKIAMKTLDKTRPAVGAQAVGLAQGALDYAVSYAKQRHQFGQPIISLQGLQFMLADAATKTEAARQLVYQAAMVVDEKVSASGRTPPEVSKLSAMSKLFSTDVAMSVTTDAVQILGGYGYMKEYPVERMMRDAKILQIIEGTNQIQRTVIAGVLSI